MQVIIGARQFALCWTAVNDVIFMALPGVNLYCKYRFTGKVKMIPEAPKCKISIPMLNHVSNENKDKSNLYNPVIDKFHRTV